MSGTYTWPQVVNGKVFAEADFRPYTYSVTLPDLLGNFAAQANGAQGAVKAAEAAASAAAAASSAAQAAARVAGVTTGSTSNLVYPEAVANLVTAADVRDVLVYDTRLDSDGGAWTRRCQHTSWWSETLNTSQRGAKRDFPTVALIVLRTGSMTIYDLHDLDGSGVPRMWMLFTAGSANQLFISGGSLPTALAASNGRIYAATTGGGGSGRFHSFEFPSDFGGYHNTFATLRYTTPISTRNSGAASVMVISTGVLPSADCADVAVRVLPGALRDSFGMPIPTIAVATSGGGSVIHPNGQAVNVTGSAMGVVAFGSDDTLLLGQSASDISVNVGPIPYASVAFTSWRTSFWNWVNGDIRPIPLAGVPTALLGDAGGYSSGLSRVAAEYGAPANSMVASVSAAFATGWQPGDQRLTTLCDSRVGALASNILVALDGTSAAGVASYNSGTVTSTGGRIRVARNGAINPGGLISLAGMTVGETYTLDFDSFVGTAGACLIVVNGATSLINSIVGDTTGGRFQFVADSTTGQLILIGLTDTGTNYAEFDNITIRAGVADRSHRSRGLHVIGSLSRAAVGTGNDVVAVSGFSASNYLEQPYSSLLDFGTGDFCIAFWVRGGAATEYLLDRRVANTAAGAGFYMYVGTSGIFGLEVSDGSTVATVLSSSATSASSWRFVVATRRNGVAEMWVDGVRENAAASSQNVNASNPLRVGIASNLSLPAATTSLTMLRISAYAPTPTQIARMFRDERALFDTGAKALLGGTTSAVQALSYSEHSQRLAAATTDGVTVFSGLRRVEYLSTGNLSPAMASNNATKIAMEAGALVVGTASNIGMRRDAITGLDRMLASPRAPFSPRRLTARGFTADATPLVLAPRLGIGERETLIVLATVVGRVFGAADGQRLSYQRRATYYRDAGGNVTLQGSVQTIGTDTEVTGTADATLVIDTTAQTVAPQVTGVAATRIVWTATLEVTRIADAQYEEIV